MNGATPTTQDTPDKGRLQINLPLPALDGGRLVFLIIEAIRGKRVPPEQEGYVHFAGIVLLMALMVFVMFNDVHRIFFGG